MKLKGIKIVWAILMVIVLAHVAFIVGTPYSDHIRTHDGTVYKGTEEYEIIHRKAIRILAIALPLELMGLSFVSWNILKQKNG